ncbi:TOMM precursor leader peptide-binding protein [Paenibacillus hamazuiensis]|uniref:TOMM precursor leader peptide-binding protein n=1 Tax=Paenibacillus hamazuiensis TaxID=2936508 RepID=UPI00200F81A3|nr:TOMM precursor leader peptide-binding protein [Paenibacillus hamazuiensis]
MTIAVIGEGLLAEIVRRELSALYEVIWQMEPDGSLPETAELVLLIHDTENSDTYRKAEELMRQKGIPWLRGFVSEDEAIIGPLVRPGAGGCFQCADNRRLLAGRDDAIAAASLHSLLTTAEIPVKDRPSFSGLAHVSHMIVNECCRLLRGKKARTEDCIYIVNLHTLDSSLHFILPDPLCEVCGQLPADFSMSARIELEPRPKIAAGSYRSRNIDELKTVLVRDYLDSRTGVFNAKTIDLLSPFAAVYMNMPSFMGDEITGGRSHCFAESELTAILEGLERRCGSVPRGKRSTIRDSYNNIAAEALNPVKVGLYNEEQYALPDFPFEPFDPDRPMDWVWGYSFLQQRPILVPESIAYYSWTYGESFVQEGSNGSALGGSLEEAILYGILEVAERDSFLMTWYAQLPVPRLEPDSSGDRELRLMIERLKAVAGYEVRLFNITTENRIPVILALAKSGEPGKMNLICAAGSHLDPVRAAKSAIHELSGLIGMLNERFEERRDELMEMFHEPNLVKQIEDHALLNGLAQAEERFCFLLDDRRPMQSFAEQFKRKSGHTDLTEDLKDILHTFQRLNLDVIVINQTSPEIGRNRLNCVKVLIPGMLPMTFGHQFTRLNGLDRVLSIPAELGYVSEPLKREQLNPHPHPFI